MSTDKIMYGQSFVIYAMSECALATGDAHARAAAEQAAKSTLVPRRTLLEPHRQEVREEVAAREALVPHVEEGPQRCELLPQRPELLLRGDDVRRRGLTKERHDLAQARIVLFAVDSRPRRMSDAEALLVGQPPSASLFERAGEAASGAIEEPLSDVHASAEFRLSLAQTLVRRALTEAAEKARAA